MMVKAYARVAALLFPALLLAIAALVVASCGGDDDNSAAPTRPASTVAASTPAGTAGGLAIIGVSVRATTNDVSAAYFTVKNTGPADRLLKAVADVTANVQLHEVVTTGGTAKMQPVAGLDVPANGQLELKPGGYHVMLLDLKSPLKQGQTVKLELRFEKAGTITVMAPVTD
jgi:hypothetical protein